MTCNSIPNTVSPKTCSLVLLTFLVAPMFLIALSPAELHAQQRPTLRLEEHQGIPFDGTLTIGKSLWIHLYNATPGAQYRLEMLDETGATVEEMMVLADPNGRVSQSKDLIKTSLQDCSEEGGGAIGIEAAEDFQGPFSNISEASLALNGRTFTLTISDSNEETPWHNEPILFEEPQEPYYYWSDEFGNERCFFMREEPIFLSVFQGDLEEFNSSRMFVFHPPPPPTLNPLPQATSSCPYGRMFIEARVRPDCEVTAADDCRFSTGSEEENFPQLQTIPMAGELPNPGRYRAIIRSFDGLQDERLYSCDRLTSEVIIGDLPVSLSENAEDWSCPSCRL